MKNLRVSNRYAKALLGLAEENNIADRAFEDMKLIYTVFSQNKELKSVLKSPIVRVGKKLNILKAIFESKLNPLIMHYLTIITRKKRSALIQGIAYEYLNIYRERLDIEKVTLVTAGEIDKPLFDKAHRIASIISQRKNIEFNQNFDPGIVGGFILRVGDLQYDASVKRRLSRLEKQLLQGS